MTGRQFLLGTLCVTIALGIWIACQSAAPAQSGGRGGGRHGGGQSQGDSGSGTRKGVPPPPATILTPHCGNGYLDTPWAHLELVYQPLQVRIYRYDLDYQPQSTRGLQGSMSLQLPDENAPRQISLEYHAMPGAGEQDYLLGNFDLRQLPDKDTPITIEIRDTADTTHPAATFVPLFTPDKIRPYVAKAQLTKGDRDGVFRQRVCPVSGDVLGTRGPIIKLLIGDYPLYVSGAESIAAVREHPEKYLPAPPPGPPR